MSQVLLQVQGLHVSYGPVRALRGIDLMVREGETVAVIGANGAGKTTLMRALSGIVPASEGRADFCGMDIRRTPAHRLARAGLLHVPEGRGTLATMSVRENLRMAWEIRPSRIPFEQALEPVYGRFPRLKERSLQLAGSLSGGEQQMLAISRALINPPRLLLIDEPSMGLSPMFTTEVYRLLASLRDAGLAILLVEQNVRSALALASRAYVLAQGEFTAEGPADALARDPVIVESYLGKGKHAATPIP